MIVIGEQEDILGNLLNFGIHGTIVYNRINIKYTPLCTVQQIYYIHNVVQMQLISYIHNTS